MVKLLLLVLASISFLIIGGTYIGSPWGFIRGKIGDYVGGVWKGIDWVRVRVLPTQRGTLAKYRLLKDGLIDPSQFSYPQMNIRRAVVQWLGYVARMKLSAWIYPVWQSLVIKRGWVMTGTNAFVKRNSATLLATMDRDLEFDPATNTPDLTNLLVSDGDLEAGYGIDANYDTLTGAFEINWQPSVYTNGQAGDQAFFLIAKKPILESVGRDGTWAPKLYMYGNALTSALTPPPPAVVIERSAGTASLTLPVGLDAADLTAYVFFRDAEGVIGFSPSVGTIVTAV